MKACTRFVFSGPPSRWCIIIFLSVSLGVEFCFLTNQSLLNHLDWFVDCFAEIQEHGIKKVNSINYFLDFKLFYFLQQSDIQYFHSKRHKYAFE
jgi:hypothetical protein